MGIHKPKALKLGDTIAVIAPSSWFDRTLLQSGMEALRSAGFNITHRDDLFDQLGYLAGSDDRRTQEFLQYLQDPKVGAIMCARGGYGAQRIVPHLNLNETRAIPKQIIGYSDVTVLLNLLHNESNWVTLYGPTVAKHLGDGAPPENMEWLLRALTATAPLGALPMREAVVVKPGSAKGPIAGGCLTLVQMGIGTRYDVKTRGSILFLEDRGEKLYEIDRMLQHLKHAGKLDGVQGIVFGSMMLHPQDSDKQHALVPMLNDVLSDFNGPIVANFPAGHTDPFMPLPMGVMSVLSTDPLAWTVTESHLSP